MAEPAVVKPATLTSQAREYVRLHRRLTKLEAAAARVKKAKNELQDELLERFAEEGVGSLRIDGALVHLHSILWAGRESEVDAEAACDALIDSDLGDYVARGFNTNSISALFREYQKAADEANALKLPHPDDAAKPPEAPPTPWTLWDFAPATLRGVIKTGVQTTVRVKES